MKHDIALSAAIFMAQMLPGNEKTIFGHEQVKFIAKEALRAALTLDREIRNFQEDYGIETNSKGELQWNC